MIQIAYQVSVGVAERGEHTSSTGRNQFIGEGGIARLRFLIGDEVCQVSADAPGLAAIQPARLVNMSRPATSLGPPLGAL